MNTFTQTSTYTVIDIKKTFEGLEADLRIIARRTEKWEMDEVDDVFHDILKLAENKYLSSIDIVLVGNNNKPIKAAKYTINANGTATASDRAGKNRWKNIPDTSLTVILSYTSTWRNLSREEKSKFQKSNSFKNNWTSTSINNSFPHLKKRSGQLYASKGYELQKNNYE